MFVHLLSAAALTGGLIAGPSTPDPVSAVTTLKYKVGIVNLSTIDLSGLGAGEQGGQCQGQDGEREQGSARVGALRSRRHGQATSEAREPMARRS